MRACAWQEVVHALMVRAYRPYDYTWSYNLCVGDYILQYIHSTYQVTRGATSRIVNLLLVTGFHDQLPGEALTIFRLCKQDGVPSPSPSSISLARGPAPSR